MLALTGNWQWFVYPLLFSQMKSWIINNLHTCNCWCIQESNISVCSATRNRTKFSSQEARNSDQMSNYCYSFFNTCQVRNGRSIFMTYFMKGRWVSYFFCTYACTCTHFCDNRVKAFILGILVWLIRLLFSNIWSCGGWQKFKEVWNLVSINNWPNF
jgi:hypothetical protein